ncbi:MAG: hypothetical protein QM791_06615 [Ferruginibacter sp.]
MDTNDFFPGMKVSLNGEFGVVTNEFEQRDWTHVADKPSKHYGIIRWDTDKESDMEDWIGLFGTFKDCGGIEVSSNHCFRFINDDGSFKLKEK